MYKYMQSYLLGGIVVEKKRVVVQIEGRNYVVITTEDEKYVNSVADEVISRIRKATQASKNFDTRDCAILAALDLCDDRNKAVKKSKALVGKADKIIQNTNELNKYNKEYKEKLTEAINENTRLSKKIKALENQLITLSNENEELRKNGGKLQKAEKDEKTAEEIKNEKLMGYVPMAQGTLFDDEEN